MREKRKDEGDGQEQGEEEAWRRKMNLISEERYTGSVVSHR